MAIKTSLRPIIRRIAEAIESYATAQGLARNDYALAGTWDQKTNRISLVFGTDRRIDERQWYAGILQSIRQSFSDQPWITRNIGLVVENVENLDEVYLHFSGSEDESDLTELLERTSSRKRDP
jgi:hypothetical protein